MEFKVNNDFESWAAGFSGCDGGNIQGPIWVCGIEPGGQQSIEQLQFSAKNDPPQLDENSQAKNFLRWPYNLAASRLCASVVGGNADEYQVAYKHYRVFSSDGCSFKMNLYPLQFKDSTDGQWTRAHYVKTGLPTKPVYKAWCQLNRFPVIQGWVEKYKPLVIICTGRTYTREFLHAFGGLDAMLDKDVLKVENYPPPMAGTFECGLINNGRTIMAVTPFLGRGQMGRPQITRCGNHIQKMACEHFGDEWSRRLSAINPLPLPEPAHSTIVPTLNDVIHPVLPLPPKANSSRSAAPGL